MQFHRPRHGIYREIPFRYADDLGESITTPMKVHSVTDSSGKKWGVKIENKGDVVHIRIGDPEKYVSGVQTYLIEYTVDNAVLFLNDHDELYWNVTGNYWQAPIKEASAAVILASKTQNTARRASCYTGAYRSRESACTYETFGNTARFSTEKSLNAGEGLTIAFGWDKGLVHPPSAWKKFIWKAKENWSFVLPPLTLAFMTRLWLRRGRDPRVKESLTVMYEPPKYGGKPLSPAEVGTIVDERLDPRDITSTIVGLAVKGYIRIEENKEEGLIFDTTDYYLSKIKEPDEHLGVFEKDLMKSLFQDSRSGVFVSDLKNKFYANLESLKKTLYGELVGKRYFLKSPDRVRNFYLLTGLIISLVSAAVSVFVTLALFTSASFTPFALIKSAFAGLFTGLPFAVFSRVMPAKTKVGASTYADILGFQEFLNRAEKDRLERMGDKDLFSRYLPYAISLDVADNWAKAFEGIYQNPPQWYTSAGGISTFSPRTFSRSVGSMTSALGAAVFSAPRGSGGSSGGGGFSGGGFGGGGGGSW